eukprot:CAMPEP_0197413754 /NCGR_PEP_ID=MMETSP1170-20131217/586_1 /TAXON_ID=54406 /ORGANISM="Sarcinochrysis sp, Strain CCMP770" /LENGTH=146 /DNA_ID=CAMNT_0042940387 /DNA_START=22 /DNA_END=462 /DNA_ORIENTATION=-
MSSAIDAETKSEDASRRRHPWAMDDMDEKPSALMMKAAKLSAQEWRAAHSSPIARVAALHDAMAMIPDHPRLAIHSSTSYRPHLDIVYDDGTIECPYEPAALRPGAFADFQSRARLAFRIETCDCCDDVFPAPLSPGPPRTDDRRT